MTAFYTCSSSIKKPDIIFIHFSFINYFYLAIKNVLDKKNQPDTTLIEIGGQGWIRTIVDERQQIYSLPPLATRTPTQMSKK